MEAALIDTPVSPSSAKLQPSRRFAAGVNSQKPTASPAKANATQGNSGNNHGCGSLKICTPLRYDSSGQGRNRGRAVVHSAGVASATSPAPALAPMMLLLRAAATEPFP